MKVVAFNSSPNRGKGNTQLILQPFIDGMKEAGAEVELFYVMDLNIKPCQGEYNCWFKTPGKCIHNDDMADILPKFHKSDILVFATPLYVDGMSGPMKNFFDRMIASGTPEIVIRDGRCRHEGVEGHRDRKIVLVSNCGFWEIENFDPLVVHMKAIAENFNAEFSGALLRPHGAAMKPMMKMGFKMDGVFDACREAGKELIVSGRISDNLLREISKVIIPKEMYVAAANEQIAKIKS
ncbi:MAG TPA: flavodoxin family protein [Firmicutes bacterium]|nr:flavodoxin family protein [Bacillota bacterium]